MALSNRELLRRQRRKESGLPEPIDTAATTPVKDSSRRTGRVTPKTTGTQGITQRKGLATLAAQPEAITGMKTEGSALVKEFAGLRPKEADSGVDATEAAQAGLPVTVTKGRRLTPSVRAGIKAEAGSEIGTKQRRAMGLGEFAPGKSGGVGSFGLPTDRTPSFAELGGAIGQMFKHVGGIIKQRKALGLVPGRRATTTVGKGLTSKDTADILIKQLEVANLAGNKEKAALIEAQLENIVNPRSVEDTDVETIQNL